MYSTPDDHFMKFGIGCFALAIVLVPFAVAQRRNHQHATPILIITLLFGWTGLGWIVALTWALSDNLPQAGMIATRLFLLATGIISGLFGFGIMSAARSAIHESEAFLAFLVMVVSLGAAAVLWYLDEIRARLQSGS